MRPMLQNTQAKQWTYELPFRELYRLAEVAVILGTSPPQVYGYVKRGVVQAYKVDGVLALDHQTVEWLHKRRLRRIALQEGTRKPVIEIIG